MLKPIRLQSFNVTSHKHPVTKQASKCYICLKALRSIKPDKSFSQFCVRLVPHFLAYPAVLSGLATLCVRLSASTRA
jgi:hypothetical protein